MKKKQLINKPVIKPVKQSYKNNDIGLKIIKGNVKVTF